MNIFEGLRVGADQWRIKSKRSLTPWEYLRTISATVVKGLYGYKVEFLLKNGDKYYVPLSARCSSDRMEGTVINLLSIEILTLEKWGEIIYRIEFTNSNN